jgi:ABC-2 type transport system ATP-binding protein
VTNQPSRPSPIVDVKQLSKYYERFVAVSDVSFRIWPGQIVSLLGPNGAGKTTLMRMLTGFLAPTAGRATIGGFDVQQERLGAASLVGYLPENGPLYLDMTPLEMLRFFGEARGLTASVLRERLETVTDQCGIRAILDKPVGKLSKGLRQRVGMAQALLHDPAVIVLDEPTAGLDPIQIREFRAHARALGRERTLLISTHILQEVDAIADRVFVMNNGRLVFDGTPTEFGGGESIQERFCEIVGDEASAFAGAGRER